MQGLMTDAHVQNAIRASWVRCERQHKLTRDAAQPILRLQSSEIAPRLECMVERTGGRQGIFRQIARIAADAGHCFVVTDADGILVRLESKGADSDWNGIALGSVWKEGVAGTTGVSMALLEGREFTVRGQDHFYSRLRHFACIAAPLRNAANEVIGAASLATIDRSNPSDYLFAKQLLGVAADRIQRTLFEREFSDLAIVSIAVPGRRDMLRGDEMVAVNHTGTIVGSTTLAHRLAGLKAPSDLTGRQFDTVFGADASTLDRVPGRVLSIRRDKGPLLDIWARLPRGRNLSVPGWRPGSRSTSVQRRLSPSLKELTVGCGTMLRICEQAEDCLYHRLPLLIEGKTGTGKSALIAALLRDRFEIVTVDCAALDDGGDDRIYVRSLMEQVLISRALHDKERPVALIFDNVDELPDYGQAALRKLLGAIEVSTDRPGTCVHIIATCQRSLREAVRTGHFREDLFFLLSEVALELPPLCRRRHPDLLADVLARGIAGHNVSITPEARRAIISYDWPGNVRELRSTLQQALMRGDGMRITRLDLGPAFRNNPPAPPQRAAPCVAYDERTMLLDALRGARWNVSKAARALAMGRATLHRKMKAHGISRPARSTAEGRGGA